MATQYGKIRYWPSSMARNPCRMCGVLSTCLWFIILSSIAVQKSFKFTLQPNDSVVMDQSSSNLFTFIQISDLHISYLHPQRSSSFREFATTVLDTISPSFVLITGDLTDSKEANGIRGISTESDWDLYSTILRSANRFNTSYIYDMRGNHDVFGQSSFADSSNRFGRFGVQPSINTALRVGQKRVQVLNFTPPGGNNTNPLALGTYRFVMYDTAHTFGPNLPLNTFGFATRPILDEIEAALTSPLPSPSSPSSFPRYQFFINHFPFAAQKSETSSSGIQLRNMMQLPNSRIFAHIVGHYHNVNMFNRMYQDGSGMEIELADMRSKRYFRVFTIDNDMINAVDTSIGKWPLIVITNPKNARLLSPYEPIHRISQSSHIRVLVFSPSSAPVSSVSLSIDGAQVTANMSRSPSWTPSTPLYTATWSPSNYSVGIHSMEVTASNTAGHTQTSTQSFSIDGTVDKFPSSSAQMMQQMNLSAALASALVFAQVYLAVFLLGLPKYYVWKWRREGTLKQKMANAGDFSNYYQHHHSNNIGESSSSNLVQLVEINRQEQPEVADSSSLSSSSSSCSSSPSPQAEDSSPPSLDSEAGATMFSSAPSDPELSVNQPVDAENLIAEADASQEQAAPSIPELETPNGLSMVVERAAPIQKEQHEHHGCCIDAWNHFVASFRHQRDLNLLRFGLIDFKIWIVFVFMCAVVSFGPMLIGQLSGDLFLVIFSHGMVSEDGSYQGLPDGSVVTVVYDLLILYPMWNWFSYNSTAWIQFTASSPYFSSTSGRQDEDEEKDKKKSRSRFRAQVSFYLGNYLPGLICFATGLTVINVLGVVCSSWPTIFISPICLPFTVWVAINVSLELRRHQKGLQQQSAATPLEAIITPEPLSIDDGMDSKKAE